MKPILLLFISFLIGSCTRVAEESSPIVQKYIPNSYTTISLEKQKLPIDLLYPTDIQTVDTFLLVSIHHSERIIQAYSTLSL